MYRRELYNRTHTLYIHIHFSLLYAETFPRKEIHFFGHVRPFATFPSVSPVAATP